MINEFQDSLSDAMTPSVADKLIQWTKQSSDLKTAFFRARKFFSTQQRGPTSLMQQSPGIADQPVWSNNTQHTDKSAEYSKTKELRLYSLVYKQLALHTDNTSLQALNTAKPMTTSAARLQLTPTQAQVSY